MRAKAGRQCHSALPPLGTCFPAALWIPFKQQTYALLKTNCTWYGLSLGMWWTNQFQYFSFRQVSSSLGEYNLICIQRLETIQMMISRT